MDEILFRHSSNSRELSRQKVHNELAYVFTARDARKNADWNQQQLTAEQRESSVLIPIQSEKSPDSGFFACDLWEDCIMPSFQKQITEINGEGMIAGYCISWL